MNLVAKKMLAEVPLPDPESGTWEERLREVVNDIDAKLREHPGIAEILLQRMLSTDRRLMNGIFEILISAGFEGPETFLSYAMIHTYLFGRYQVVLHADELPEEEQVDNLEDAVAQPVATFEHPSWAGLLLERRGDHHRRPACPPGGEIGALAIGSVSRR